MSNPPTTVLVAVSGVVDVGTPFGDLPLQQFMILHNSSEHEEKQEDDDIFSTSQPTRSQTHESSDDTSDDATDGTDSSPHPISTRTNQPLVFPHKTVPRNTQEQNAIEGYIQLFNQSLDLRAYWVQNMPERAMARKLRTVVFGAYQFAFQHYLETCERNLSRHKDANIYKHYLRVLNNKLVQTFANDLYFNPSIAAESLADYFEIPSRFHSFLTSLCRIAWGFTVLPPFIVIRNIEISRTNQLYMWPPLQSQRGLVYEGIVLN